ncbi:sigma-70 family RNA polymerase sigma factor [Muricauda oceani]|uniref:Sigma-70 family RNA polymerase sigma factor n=1 Tax=Flagellimonas oceani TaxID=2698672 RepID=A0A6G7J0I3_9FLAO|nr:sigma-70 family RNA polymerase sigma factor [Allomuricauda oceani]MBW8244279.1 sigma-70 family RNA polymerase sigma factor [Allomuricauda oceani]QII44074.1 sigma-70 family RNA polymerase sigma factor [Allomuricauda oceani]
MNRFLSLFTSRKAAYRLLIMDDGWKKSVPGFRSFFEKHAKRLYYTACRHLSPENAEDVVQELFIDIWERRQSIKVRTSWEGYLYAALKYRIFRFLDQQNALNVELSEAVLEAGTEEEILDFEALYLMLEDSVDKLPEQCGKVFRAKYYGNKKNKEIAKELGISIETVKSHLKRGHMLLREQMRDALANFLFF